MVFRLIRGESNQACLFVSLPSSVSEPLPAGFVAIPGVSPCSLVEESPSLLFPPPTPSLLLPEHHLLPSTPRANSRSPQSQEEEEERHSAKKPLLSLSPEAADESGQSLSHPCRRPLKGLGFGELVATRKTSKGDGSLMSIETASVKTVSGEIYSSRELFVPGFASTYLTGGCDKKALWCMFTSSSHPSGAPLPAQENVAGGGGGGGAHL